MAVKKNKPRPKAKADGPSSSSLFSQNMFSAVEHIDGNPNTPAEFDATLPGDDEMYFNAEEDASTAIKSRAKILNFIHRKLKYNTKRDVPTINPEDDEAIEVYHREVYKGVSYDVCVIYPAREEGGYKECIAIVKRTDDDLSAEGCLDGLVCSDAAWSEAAQKDKFTLIVDKLNCNYWAPRWKYVVKALCNRMAHDYDKYGNEIRPEVIADIARGTDVNVPGGAGDYGNGDVIEEVMQIFSGATGKIIGPKGAKLYEIKDATHIEDIKMPAKNEDGTRPRARELVDVTLKGTITQINAAKAMIQAVVDEWANAPRPPRDGGYTAPAPDYSADNGGGYGGGMDGAGDGSGGAVDWADDANAAATPGEWAQPVGGDEPSASWDTGAGGGNW